MNETELTRGFDYGSFLTHMNTQRTISSIVALAALLTSAFAPQQTLAFSSKSLADNRPDAATSILAAFQGSCGSQGIFTQTANAQTNAIINIFQSLKDSDACSKFADELTSIQNAASSLQSLQTSSSFAAYQTDQNQYQLMTVALQTAQATATSTTASAADVAQATADVANYQDALGKLRLQMFGDQAAYQTTTQTAGRSQIIADTTSMLTWAQQLTTTSSSPDLAQCLKQSPMAALELGTNLAAYGGSLLPGAYGSGISAIAGLITNGLEALRNTQYDDAIFNAQSNEMRDSLSCALESMTESYCTVNDSYTLLDLARNNRLANYAATPLWTGIDILNRQLPALLTWLSQVENEVPPQDSSQANKQNAVFQEIFEIQEQNLDSIAAINSALNQANASATLNAKLAAVVNGIANLSLNLVTPSILIVGNSSSSTSQTPFIEYQSNANIWACWLVLGPNTNAANCPALPANDDYGGTVQLSGMQDYISNVLKLNNEAELNAVSATLLGNWSQLVPLVQVLVNADFATKIATNAGTILAGVRDATNGNPLSPYQVLQNIQNFLGGIAADPKANPQLPLALSEEIQKIQTVMDQLDKADADVCPPQAPEVIPAGDHSIALGVLPDPAPSVSPSPIPLTPEQCQVQRLENIFNTLGLQNGTQVFLTDIDQFVNIDLQNRFTNGNIPPNATQILQASGADLDVALESAGQGDLDGLSNDLNSARSDVEGNIEVFREFFVKAFQEAVKREQPYLAEESISAGADRPHGQPLAELCMLWLFTSGSISTQGAAVVPNWPDTGTQAICEQTLYFNANTNPNPTPSPSGGASPLTPAFDVGALARQMSAMKFPDRVCAFHKYKTQNKADTLYQILPSQQ